MSGEFLPISAQDLKQRGWRDLDVIIVTGDAYVDHPSYGSSVIGRVLERAGYKVGIIAQPDWRRVDSFTKLGRPRLFFGVTAGNLDSMVAKYTANKKIRTDDDYSPGGKSGLRPDRASIIYTNRIKEAFPNAVVVLGGLEASMRRLAHYDYWSDKVRRSIILDAKADILVYGMGEQQTLEIARRIDKGESAKELNDIKGTVVIRNSLDDINDYSEIPSFEEVFNDNDKFNLAFTIVYRESDPVSGKAIIQRHGERFVVQFGPARPLTTEELDTIYRLSYERSWHPVYDNAGGVPGFETVRFSIISHRGCPAACSFCSLYMHQGRIVQSRSRRSIVEEVRILTEREDFKGTITDIGGPTANLYKADCAVWRNGACKNRSCLTPARCPKLGVDYAENLELWREIEGIPGVKHVFIGSGLRYDLVAGKDSEFYLAELCKSHVSGQLKVAPEHTEKHVLELMNKPPFSVYEKFAAKYKELNKRLKKDQYLVNYFISAHPGATLEDALKLSLTLKRLNIYPEQIQDFIPLPLTRSGCMFHTGKDPFTGNPVYVARGLRERKLQRALIQYKNPKNKRYVIEALRKLDREDLVPRF